MVDVMSVQPTSEKRTVLQLSGSAADGRGADQHRTCQPHQGPLDHSGFLHAISAWLLRVVSTCPDAGLARTGPVRCRVRQSGGFHTGACSGASGGAAQDQVGRLLRHHDRGRVQIAGDDAGHDRRVDHAQPVKPRTRQCRHRPPRARPCPSCTCRTGGRRCRPCGGRRRRSRHRSVTPAPGWSSRPR